MEFREKQAIYLQIADIVCENILLRKWPPSEKLISIRDLAVLMEVNPNTIQRTYDFLQQKEIIVNRRGVGYFVDDDAEKKIIGFRREQFIENDLPFLLRNMYLLNISPKEIEKKYESFIKSNFKTSNK